VDEAAMVSTDNLAKLAAAARQSGAKLILAGDDRQLGAIERGGMFETLRQSHGAAVLKEVQRVKDQDQQRVFGEMHEGEFLGALQLSDKAGRLHWTDKQADTVRAMTEAYTRDVTADPTKHRFMFAFTNAEVDALNDFARDIFKQRGDLGEDREIQTAYGAKEFATGDRVMFSGGGRTAAEKRAGLINGNAGTITEIDTTGPKPSVTVQLDTAKGQEPQSITFTVGDDAKAGEFDKFKLGYAGTIYKGQGDTLDQTYVCHSSLWKNSAAYVALTRHRENVEIFASRETVRGMEKAHEGEAHTTAKDLEVMARGLGRSENKRAATAYHIDNAAAVRADLESMVATLADPREQKRSPAAAINFEPRVAVPAVADARAEAEEALTGHDTGRALGGIADALGSVASGAARLADGVAGIAAQGIEALADLFGGGSSPPPAQGQAVAHDMPPPAPEPATPSRGPETPQEYTQEILQRMRDLDALTQTQGAGRALTSEQDAQLEQEAAVKKKRQEQSL
jgi:AAA domain